MMFYLHKLADGSGGDFWKAFNVFQYITFRAVAAATTAFLITLV